MAFDNLFIRPGTLLVILLIAAFGFGVFNWASSSINQTAENSMDNRDAAVTCSQLNIQVLQVEKNPGNVTAFFKVNQDVGTVFVNFNANHTITKSVKVRKGQLMATSAVIQGLDNISFKAPDCDRVFTNG